MINDGSYGRLAHQFSLQLSLPEGQYQIWKFPDMSTAYFGSLTFNTSLVTNKYLINTAQKCRIIN